MLKELSPEREKEIIDKVAKTIVDYGIAEFIEIIWDYGLRFYGNLVISIAMIELYPFTGILGSIGPDLAQFLQTDSQGNMLRIVEKVRELDDQRKQEEAARHAAEGTKKRLSFWSKIKSSFSKK